jgi:aspartate carbamoyltransferase catalytic subunit
MPFDLYPPTTAETRRHLLAITDLDSAAITRILETAEGFESVMQRDVKKVPTLRGRTVMNVFFESSTRTSSSFELAAKRLSADTMSLKASGSSVDKGESLKDTIKTLSAYDPDVIVIRHARIGAAQMITGYTDAHVVNAGDGKHQHPTQCLLDLYTMQRALGKVEGLHVAIVGDVLHSRVARSNIQGLRMMGARVTVIGPPPLLPRGIAAMGVEVSHDIADLESADVIYVLRMQQERMQEGANYVPSLAEYTTRWGVTADRVRPSQLVMHPGPMNRGVEIDSAVADGANSRITDQVRSGLVVRMAVLYDLLNGPTLSPSESALRIVEDTVQAPEKQEVA